MSNASRDALAESSSDGARPGGVVDWTPGWDWLGCILAIHVLVAVPWAARVGAWLLAVAAPAFGYYVWVFCRAESWRFALEGERVVLFEPERADGSRVPARLRGPPWMTDRWVVVRTTRRVLVLRAGRYDAAVFARLRRALLGGAANG
ncbi:MAG: hypothetical protein F4029_07045 [Gammaproteobacteria bacterium]|nr:hypothetical protein [Gammaproteobacteria bacterium]MYF29756.1 hypothetical protein [Gammaproteobacteria bacterium]MYK45967.1 hypothetical protein [Gammaproteobacteria bacterium]